MMMSQMRTEILKLKFGVVEVDRFVLAHSARVQAAYATGADVQPEASDISRASALLEQATSVDELEQIAGRWGILVPPDTVERLRKSSKEAASKYVKSLPRHLRR